VPVLLELLAPLHPLKVVRKPRLDALKLIVEEGGTNTCALAPAGTEPETDPSL
jgi:hypothetical protein